MEYKSLSTVVAVLVGQTAKKIWNKKWDAFSEEEQQRYLKKQQHYAKSHGINPDIVSLINNKGLDAYQDHRITRLNETVDKADGETLKNRAAFIRNLILPIIKEQYDDYQTLREEYESSLHHARAYALDETSKYHPNALTTFVGKELQEQAEKAIHDQFDKEKKQLTTNFEERTRAQPTPPVTLDDVLKVHETLKKDALAQFQAHTRQFTEKLEQAARLEHARIDVLSTLYENNKSFKTRIDELANARQKPKQTTIESGTAAQKRSAVRFKGIGLLDLKNIPSATNRTQITIKQTKETIDQDDGNGKKIKKTVDCIHCSMDMANAFNIFYHLARENNAKKELLALAKTQFALSPGKLVIEVSNNREDRALRDARLAYEAALEAGFKPEDISFEVQFKKEHDHQKPGKMSSAEVFASCPTRKALADSVGQSIREKKEALNRESLSPQATEMNRLRQAVQQGRDKEASQRRENRLREEVDRLSQSTDPNAIL